MDKKEIIKKVKQLQWEPWLRRGFSPFMISLFAECNKEAFSSIGFPTIKFRAALFQTNYWFQSKEVWKETSDSLEKPMQKYKMSDVVKDFAKFKKKSNQKIERLLKEKKDPIKKIAEAYKIIRTDITYIWLTHGAEELFNNILAREVPKYVKGDTQNFIAEASFPKRKNEVAKMQEAMLKGVKPEIIAKKWGWMRARDAFEEPYSISEIKELIKNTKPTEKHKSVKIPKQLKEIFKEAQELVFFRTERTDAYYHHLFLMRPLLKEIAKFYNLSFEELKYYTIQSLIKGKPKRYNKEFTYIFYKDKYYFFNGNLFEEPEKKELNEAKGTVAFKGLVTGTAKIIHHVSEVSKVQKGDILVTQMTFPSFISAMNKAVAFVTDEGGITCHAAIVAREMRKPCITGTKIATKIFKDGDLIEVDAEKGIVRILRRK